MKPHPGLTARAMVTRVVDGDTLDVELRVDARIRLIDCWAPESRTLNLDEKQRGLAAKANLEALTQTESCIVVIPFDSAASVGDVLTLDRILGRVWMDGHDADLSTQQVVGGFSTTAKAERAGT